MVAAQGRRNGIEESGGGGAQTGALAGGTSRRAVDSAIAQAARRTVAGIQIGGQLRSMRWHRKATGRAMPLLRWSRNDVGGDPEESGAVSFSKVQNKKTLRRQECRRGTLRACA